MVDRLPVFSVRPDLWLSEILGRGAYQLSLDADGATAQALFENLQKEPVFVTAKIASSDVTAVQDLEERGFRVVDTSLFFETVRSNEPMPEIVRVARDIDRDRVVEIARSAFTYSRFHLDPAFPAALANRIKAEWAENYFRGQRGDVMYVAEDSSLVVGFILLLGGDNDDCIIDLVAVAPESNRQGFGRQLIAAAISHGGDSDGGVAKVVVGTQASNRGSVNLYESMGFRLRSSQYVLHHHGSHAIDSNGLVNA